MRISDIDTKTKEGKLLMAAIVILTTSKKVMVLGKQIKGTQMKPDTLLRKIEILSKQMFS